MENYINENSARHWDMLYRSVHLLSQNSLFVISKLNFTHLLGLYFEFLLTDHLQQAL